ncbi:hypothetical protein PYCCODRAFT_1215820 [Trametes coccinea BRFM310]|uniref:Uncharacterized protein n=1 Tax=Trametes coccinea (strain BRFM310) TaxID=1353009 RepID=A0A1Y2I958_TRAC3|nr:hypothetical protein PYCCODRAFT_1215820 [Trametes coccinea BRFM310]
MNRVYPPMVLGHVPFRIPDRRTRTARVPQCCVYSTSAGRFIVSCASYESHPSVLASFCGYVPWLPARRALNGTYQRAATMLRAVSGWLWSATKRDGRRGSLGTNETKGLAVALLASPVWSSGQGEALIIAAKLVSRTCLGSYRAWTRQSARPPICGPWWLQPRCASGARHEALPFARVTACLPGSELHLTRCEDSSTFGPWKLNARQRLRGTMGLPGQGLRWLRSLLAVTCGIMWSLSARGVVVVSESGILEMQRAGSVRGEIIFCRLGFRLPE